MNCILKQIFEGIIFSSVFNISSFWSSLSNNTFVKGNIKFLADPTVKWLIELYCDIFNCNNDTIPFCYYFREENMETDDFYPNGTSGFQSGILGSFYLVQCAKIASKNLFSSSFMLSRLIRAL